jgi:hypothetical protein
MKTTYTFILALLISLSAIKGQSLISIPQGGESSLKVEITDSLSNATDRTNELNCEGNAEYQSNTDNQLLSTMYTQKKASVQSNSTVYLLDSLIYKDNTGIYQSKYEYNYNSKGLEALNTSYTWDATNKILKRSSKSESTYDSNGNRTIYISYTWDATNNLWKMSTKYEYTFDSNGYLTLNSSFKWDATNNVWINWVYSDNTYDSNGHKTLFVSYLWDTTNKIWNMTNKSEYIIGSNGLITSFVNYTYTANIWKESSKTEYTYDSNGNRTLFVSYTWDTTNNTWKASSKTEYTYDSNGLQTIYITYTWDATNNIWKGGTKTEYTYDSNGYQILNIIYSWDATNNIWKASSKNEYTYDSNGNKAQLFHSMYSSSVWVQNQIGTYYYSILINTSEVIIPANIKINIYPNPAKSEFRINGLNDPSRFTLVDLNGKLIMSRSIMNNEAISISSLPKGIYIVKIITHEGKNIVSKLIKE